MAWQFSSAQPIYLQIVDAIALRIYNGTYAAGERLPSVRDLAMTAAVNPNTMQRALSALEDMGLVDTQRTSGRTVTTDQAAVDKAKNEMASQLADTFLSQMRSMGLRKDAVLALLSARDDEQEEEQNGNDA